MRLLIDMDGISVDLMGRALELYNLEFDDDKTIDDIDHYYLDRPLGKAGAEYVRSFFDSSEFWEGLDAIPGAIEAIKRLNTNHDVLIVTSPAKGGYSACVEGKYKWLQANMPFIDEKQYVFCWRKDIVHGDLLFDDKPDNIANFRGLTASLKYNYNKHCNPTWWVKDWEHFVSSISVHNQIKYY